LRRVVVVPQILVGTHSGVQTIATQRYANTHYVNHYTNQLNLAMQQDTDHILEV
jgi:hypothetical protein